MVEDNREVYDFYENGAEIGRLERGLGIVEAARTKAVSYTHLGTRGRTKETEPKICDRRQRRQMSYKSSKDDLRPERVLDTIF